MRVVLDEDVPRAFGRALEAVGFEVIDVRDVDLRGASDEAIFRFAHKRKALLMTEDLGFTNPALFHLRGMRGILIDRLPQTLSMEKRVHELEKLLRALEKSSLIGFITVFEVGRVRRHPLPK